MTCESNGDSNSNGSRKCFFNSESKTANSEVHNKEEFDKMVENIKDFKQNVSSFAKSVFHLTNESFSDFNDFAKDYSFNWLFDVDGDSSGHMNQMRKNVRNFFTSKDVGFDTVLSELEESSTGMDVDIDAAFPKPYETRDAIHSSWCKRNQGGYDGISTGISDFYGGRFSDLISGSFRNGRTPFGYYAYKTPSTRAYNNCLNKAGESVWDSRGYWRCLFPNREVPVELLNYKQEKLRNTILTKEDLDNAILEKGVDETTSKGVVDLGEKGVFFRKFDDYLSWKNIMYANLRQQREEARKKYLERVKTAKEVQSQAQPPVETDSNERRVVSNSYQSFYTQNSETNEVELKEIKTESFNDGTSLTKTILKTRPLDAKDWVTVKESVSENGKDTVFNPQLDSGSKGTNGWFWNSKN
ncbi:hypothetical protein G9P44_003124 [Scheffersomyces stipitis]|nr:hypothetical protein G9P44_003124 [Scheffersomyces stipitis]